MPVTYPIENNTPKYTNVNLLKKHNKWSAPWIHTWTNLISNISINDIINSTSLNLLSFADDTTVYKSGPDVDILIYNINQELKHLYDWLCANKLSLNNLFFGIFSPPNNKYQVNKCININNENINYSGKDNKEESVKF